MLKAVLTLPIIALMLSPSWSLAAAGARDRYANFAAMTAEKMEGVDFQVQALDRGSHIAVLAVHGGIEILTQDIARAIAGDDFNLYVFETLVPKGKWAMHVTSTHFDDPRAAAIMANSTIGISIHGYMATQDEKVCIGGGNEALRDYVAEKLQGLVLVESPCRIFNGQGRANIVNQAVEQGVQLELSRTLRGRMENEPELLAKFVAVLRDAMVSFPCERRLDPES